jgi:gamma-glutamyltranspeptidase
MKADFQHYKTFWRKPLKYTYLDEEIYLPNGASMGGALMTLALDWYSKKIIGYKLLNKLEKCSVRWSLFITG